MSDRVFSAKVIVLLAALAVFLFSLGVALSAYEDPIAASDSRAGAGAFSTSSLGYAGLYDLLGRLGRRVETAVDPEIAPARGGVLVLAEPNAGEARRTEDILAEPPSRLFLVLPKWKPIRDGRRSRWIAGVESAGMVDANALLQAAGVPGSVVRQAAWPEKWRINELGVTPSGNAGAQLVRSASLRPVVVGEPGMLVGEWKRGDRTVWVLSDPDVMANHGIVLGDNAAFMIALFAAMDGAGADRPLVFEESVHGYSPRRFSPLRLLFEFPLVIVTILAALSALLLALAGARRFGQPRRAALPLGFGKERLLDSTARLMEYAGHGETVIRRYVRMHVRLAAEALHAPPALEGTELAAWLDRHARAPERRCGEILRGMPPPGGAGDMPAAMDCAAAIHAWREKVLSAHGRK